MIVGCSPAIIRAKQLVERFGPTRLPFLLVGATGTGKELLAEHIHMQSGRPGPLVDVNCGALPRDMMESLLFGHKRGSFTGALESVQGHVERSDRGTLFLDEIASLHPEGQVKLLRVLETGAVQPLGAAAKRQLDLRVVAAVQDGILHQVDTGQFRRDLFQRIAGVVIQLPPLAERPEDIVPLAAHFAARRGQRLEVGVEAALLNYGWPGNVRELKMAIERAGELVENGSLAATAVLEGIALGAPIETDSEATLNNKRSAPQRLGLLDSDHLLAVCESAAWRVEVAARRLGVSRASLYRRLRALGIPPRPSQSRRLSEMRR